MESTAQQHASNTAHHSRSSPQLLLIFAGPPLSTTQRLKIDLKLKWSICNTSFLPIPPRGTETFHKNHTKHPTYALTSPHQFLIPHCTHASKRKFLTAPFSFCVLFLSGNQVSLWHHPQVLFSPYYLLSHNTKQIPCASPPCCPADCQGSDLCHLKLTLAAAKWSPNTDTVQRRLFVPLKSQPLQSPKHIGWALKDAEHFLISLTWDLGEFSTSNADLRPQPHEWRIPLVFYFPMIF